MKKTLALVLALVMVFALAACGSSNSGSAPAQNGDPAQNAAPASNDAPAANAAPAAGGEILIGCLQDITGATSSLGKSVQMGAEAAVAEVNANGGINGKTVKMITYDTKGDVTEAVNAYITAVTVDKVAVIIGPPVANIAHAIKVTSEDYDVPIVGFALDPTCQIKDDGSVYKNMFCLQPSAISQSEIVAAYALKNGSQTFGVLYNEQNAYSLSLLTPFIEYLSGQGINDVIVNGYDASAADFKTLLQPYVTANVDAIYLPNYTADLVKEVTALTELGFEGNIITGLDGAPSFNTIYGGDCSNVYYTNNIDIYESATAAIIEQVGSDVAAINKYFLGYDAIMAVKDCIEKVGEEPAALVEALANIKDLKGLTGTLTMDPATHMPAGMKMFVYKYDNQTPVMLEEFAA